MWSETATVAPPRMLIMPKPSESARWIWLLTSPSRPSVGVAHRADGRRVEQNADAEAADATNRRT